MKNKVTMWKGIKVTDWVTATAALAGVIVGAYVLLQNSATIKAAQESLQLSVVPSIEIEYPLNSNLFAFTIQNRSGIAITDLEVYPVCYLVSSEGTRPILTHSRSSSIFQPPHPRLNARESLVISLGEIVSRCPIPDPADTRTSKNYSLAVVFHREIDNKRFVHFELFGGGSDQNGMPLAVPLTGNIRAASGGGDPTELVRTYKRILEVEKFYYRAEE